MEFTPTSFIIMNNSGRLALSGMGQTSLGQSSAFNLKPLASCELAGSGSLVVSGHVFKVPAQGITPLKISAGSDGLFLDSDTLGLQLATCPHVTPQYDNIRKGMVPVSPIGIMDSVPRIDCLGRASLCRHIRK